MRVAAVLTLGMIGLTGAAQPAPRVPVVVELFTSEGCSSCPPADVVLSRLAREQPVPGAQIIALGMHVTYWDQLGWKDQASLEEATRRQQDYGRQFGEDRVYTPQAVVDGARELVGSDRAGLERAIAAAATQPHAQVTLAVQTGADGVPVARVAIAAVPRGITERLRTLVLVTEDGVTSVVKRGENHGRTLEHDAVVRRLSTNLELRGLPAAWRRDHLHVIAIVQGERTQHIFGAAIAPIQ
jgi:hypothetical protein